MRRFLLGMTMISCLVGSTYAIGSPDTHVAASHVSVDQAGRHGGANPAVPCIDCWM